MQLAKFKDVTLLQHSTATAAVGASCPLACGSHPERVVLLGQVGQDVGVEQSSLKEAAPQCCQLGAELAHVPADLLRHLLVVFLQLMKGERGENKKMKQSVNTSTLTICPVLFQDLHHQHKVYGGPELLLLKGLEKKRQQRFIHQSINPHCSPEENSGRRVN